MKIFSLNANCIPVKGANRSIICDVYRKRFDFIPNALFFILDKYSNLSIDEIKNKFKNKHDESIDEYFEFLLKNEYVFRIDKSEKKLFPKLDLQFESPSIITNCIIDINSNSNYSFKKVAKELISLLTYHIEIRFFSDFTFAEISTILKNFDYAEFNIHLVIKFNNSFTPKLIEELSTNYFVSSITIYDFPDNKIGLYKKLNPFNIYFNQKKEISEKECGVVLPSNFRINKELFTESQLFNSCLNRKVGIDVDGNIKNCPSMKTGFGNINNISISDIIKKTSFKKIWNITKNQIETCKDCEFRYICTDCRAYTEKQHDLYSKPLKCGYSPYSNEWEDWSTNPLKQNAIKHYEKND